MSFSRVWAFNWSHVHKRKLLEKFQLQEQGKLAISIALSGVSHDLIDRSHTCSYPSIQSQ